MKSRICQFEKIYDKKSSDTFVSFKQYESPRTKKKKKHKEQNRAT